MYAFLRGRYTGLQETGERLSDVDFDDTYVTKTELRKALRAYDGRPEKLVIREVMGDETGNKNKRERKWERASE